MNLKSKNTLATYEPTIEEIKIIQEVAEVKAEAVENI